MRLLTARARLVGCVLVGAVVTLGTAELAFGERSIADLGILSVLIAITIATLGILRTTTQSLRSSEQGQQELAIRLSQQHTLARLGQHALTDISLEELLGEAVAGVADELGTDAAFVLEADPAQRVLRPRASFGSDDGEPVPDGGRSLAGYTLEARASVIMPEAGREARFEISTPMRKHGIVSAICTGLSSSSRTILRSGRS